MRKPEQRLWDRMRRNLAQRDVLLERIENLVATGTPDIHALCRGVHTWVELKEAPTPPVRSTTPLLGGGRGLRDAQKNWLMMWHRHCGRAVVVIGVGSTELLVVPGKFGDAINSLPLVALRAISVAGSWDELFEVLSGERRL